MFLKFYYDGITHLCVNYNNFTAIPAGAKVRPGECRFERDMCDWSNGTDKSPASWRMATVNRRPANLPDKTFGAPG